MAKHQTCQVAVSVEFETEEGLEDFFNQMVGHKQHYEKWWQEFTVTDPIAKDFKFQVILRASVCE